MLRPTLKLTRALGPAALAVLPLLSACDSTAFVPPPPPELSAMPDPRPATTAVRSVEVVLAAGEGPDRSLWVQAARQVAAQSRVTFGTSAPGPGEPPARQAGLIRAAAGRKPSALIVEPADDPAVAAAVSDVLAQGAPVVLVGRRPAGLDPGAKSRPHLVTFVPLDGPARRLVDAVRADARARGLSDDGHALVVAKIGSDSAEAAAALAAALKAAGVRGVAVRSLDAGPEGEPDAKAVTALVKADPQVTLLLGADQASLIAASSAAEALSETRPLGVGGCGSLNFGTQAYLLRVCAAVLDRNLATLGREAIRQALRLVRGEAAAEVVELPVGYFDRPPGEVPPERPRGGFGPPPAP